MYKIFIGNDKRTNISTSVLIQSIIEKASKPISITVLNLDTLPIKRKGLTDFTFSRYLVPYLSNFEGKSLFIDSDTLFLEDPIKLFEEDHKEAVSVVPFTGEFAFERPSVMLFNNALCQNLTPEYIDNPESQPQSFSWAESVGKLSNKWNFLVLYQRREELEAELKTQVGLVHYTAGGPFFKECEHHSFNKEWFKTKENMLDYCAWLELHGSSVHCENVLDNLHKKGK